MIEIASLYFTDYSRKPCDCLCTSIDDNTINNNGTNLGLKLQVMAENYFQENYAITLGFGFAFNHGGTLQYDNGGALWRNTLGEEAETFPAGVDLKHEIENKYIRDLGHLEYK